MATTLTFEQERGYGTGEGVIRVPVRVLSGVVPFTVQAVLDTGAYISVFDSAYAPSFGIPDYTAGEPMPLTPANGQTVVGYKFRILVEVWGRELIIPAVFYQGFPNLLGMQGFFDQIRIAFDHGRQRYYVSP